MATAHSHCSYCGTPFDAQTRWPRICAGCGETTWRNPLPVAVVLLPIDTTDGLRGLVVLRRDIDPGRGELALPGGFIEIGEDWRSAAVRELWEETGLTADSESAALFDVASTPGTINIFAVLPVREQTKLPVSAPTSEATEWMVITAPIRLAFPTHEAAVRRYFASK
jgi:ADP-ribose pyrophosphatase YjhB (NUDIX family)